MPLRQHCPPVPYPRSSIPVSYRYILYNIFMNTILQSVGHPNHDKQEHTVSGTVVRTCISLWMYIVNVLLNVIKLFVIYRTVANVLGADFVNCFDQGSKIRHYWSFVLRILWLPQIISWCHPQNSVMDTASFICWEKLNTIPMFKLHCYCYWQFCLKICYSMHRFQIKCKSIAYKLAKHN